MCWPHQVVDYSAPGDIWIIYIKQNPSEQIFNQSYVEVQASTTSVYNIHFGWFIFL